MNISGINHLSQNNVSSQQSAPDSRESSLRKEISNLQEELRTISNDQEMSDDQKTRKKQSAREQLQDLNSELRQYQIQKRQEEAAQKQEAAKQALKETGSKQTRSEEHQSVQATDGQTTDNGPANGKASPINDKALDAAGSKIESEKEEKPQPALLGSKESGVLITLSSTKEQIADMSRIRTSLEGRQRTAPTEEEKASLQKKINRVSGGIGKKIIITEDTVSSLHKGSDNESDKAKQTANALEQHKEELKIYSDQQLDAINRTGIINNKKMFDNISVIFN
ncbi:MAG: FlxA-like family protein [Bacteroidales bacterium]|nr:FlxA-like family protein [Lachnoclostridium sp.]MCM1384564.1 FlxA-like family protein [Lachnoclostridium sp.]MCM1465154.1 FlxA-like family protein [Bacteroidales bacterium]